MRKAPPPPRRGASTVLNGDRTWEILTGDCLNVLAKLPPKSIHMVVTSPPYWALRDYKADGQLGQEPSPQDYVASLAAIMRAVHRVLRDDGTLWLNLGDTRADKGYLGIPWRVALGLIDEGWILRNEVIWHKTKLMPEPHTDRLTTDHEPMFLFAKTGDYYFDGFPLRRPSKVNGAWRGRNRRTVWPIATSTYSGAHFATFPPQLVEPAILAGTSARGACVRCGAPWRRVIKRVGEQPKAVPSAQDTGRSGRGDLGALRNDKGQIVWNGLGMDGNKGRWAPSWAHDRWEPGCSCGAAVEPCVVLDPFVGSGTALVAALRHLRRGIGIELNPDHVEIAEARVQAAYPLGNLRGRPSAVIGPPGV